MKTEQEINKEIQRHKEAIKNKMGEKTQDDKIHLLTSITRKKGIKREIGVINFDYYDLNYCPKCGRKLGDDKR